MSTVWLSLIVPPQAPAYLLTLADVFMVFFIMIGPIKMIGPFAAGTAGLTTSELRRTAFKVFAIALVTVLITGAVGAAMLRKWHIAPPVLQLAGGLVFLLVALQMVMTQYRPPAAAAAGPATVAYLVFPVTLPAYGIAAVIALVAMSASTERLLWILGLAVIVLVLNLLVTLVVRPLLKVIGQLPLQILGAVLGMLQVALALQLIVSAVHQLRGWSWPT